MNSYIRNTGVRLGGWEVAKILLIPAPLQTLVANFQSKHNGTSPPQNHQHSTFVTPPLVTIFINEPLEQTLCLSGTGSQCLRFGNVTSRATVASYAQSYSRTYRVSVQTRCQLRHSNLEELVEIVVVRQEFKVLAAVDHAAGKIREVDEPRPQDVDIDIEQRHLVGEISWCEPWGVKRERDHLLSERVIHVLVSMDNHTDAIVIWE